MHRYRYLAKSEQGKTVRGLLSAEDEAALYRLLRLQDLYLVSSRCTDVPAGSVRRLKAPEISDFCQQLGMLLNAGVTLVRALGILCAEEGVKPRTKALYESLLIGIRQGTPLSDVMQTLGNAFPPLLIHMFRAAEDAGNLDKTALRMASHYSKEHKLNQKIRSAMTYPAVVLALAVVVLIFVMVWVVPQFQSLFDQLPSLPLPTRIILGLSDIIRRRWSFILCGLIVAVVAVRSLLQLPGVRLWSDRVKLRLPVIGKLLSTVYTARFARTLSSLYASGMPIITALQVGRSTIGNAYIEAQFDAAIEQVRRGSSLSKALETVDGLRRKLSSSVYVGEETGKLDTMLSSIAEGMDYEADIAIQRMVTMLEPAMLILMAALVGFVIVGVMLPIFDTYSVYGNNMGGL